MDWGEFFKAVGTIAASMITTFGGGFFLMKKFYVERQDSKEEKETQLLIDNAITKVKEEMRAEIKDAVQQGIVDCGEIGDRAILKVRDEFMKSLEEGLDARGREGKERFDVNSKQIEANSKQLAENSKQIEEILGIVKDQAVKYDTMADSLTSLNKVTTSYAKIAAATAEAQCNTNYDRLLFVTNKVLKSGKMTITDKTNLKQLYSSWKELGGKDPTGKMDTMYEECMGMELTLEDGI